MSIFTKHKFLGPEDIRIALSGVKRTRGMALVGGVALSWWGCPRLTRSVDVAILPDLQLTLEPSASAVNFIFPGVYAELYEDAIDKAIEGPDGFPTVTPEYLAAMKLAIHDLRHRLDLKWLLGKKDLIDRAKLKKIVKDFVGGRFALDALEVIEEEVELDIAMDQNRSEKSYP